MRNAWFPRAKLNCVPCDDAFSLFISKQCNYNKTRNSFCFCDTRNNQGLCKCCNNLGHQLGWSGYCICRCKFLFGTVIINYSYFCLLSNTNQTDRLLHGQGAPTGFSHELVMYQKSNELAQRILNVFQVTIEARYKPSEAWRFIIAPIFSFHSNLYNPLRIKVLWFYLFYFSVF